jgi:hypothetical protein
MQIVGYINTNKDHLHGQKIKFMALVQDGTVHVFTNLVPSYNVT